MSDHLSGPRAMSDPTIDITDVYAFPTPGQPGRFTLVMNIFPLATMTALFSDAVNYQFRLRPVAASTAGEFPSFAAEDDERVVSVTFNAPQADGEGRNLTQTGTCVWPSGEAVSFTVGDTAGGEANGLHAGAGCFLDPFYIDQSVLGAIRTTRQLPDQVGGQNTVDGLNVLGIIIESDTSALFGTAPGPLFAVLAETTTIGTPQIRLERVGRPEMKNFVLADKNADTVNRDLEIRDIYNMEDAFKLLPDYLAAYRARLNSNLAFYDGLDGKADWSADTQGTHALTELLLADFLVVDVSKPFSEDGYLEIERALMAGAPHETCGGRTLNHDMPDTFLTFLINNGNGPRIRDGVDHATVPASATFPYLQPANPKPPSRPNLAMPTALVS